MSPEQICYFLARSIDTNPLEIYVVSDTDALTLRFPFFQATKPS